MKWYLLRKVIRNILIYIQNDILYIIIYLYVVE